MKKSLEATREKRCTLEMHTLMTESEGNSKETSDEG